MRRWSLAWWFLSGKLPGADSFRNLMSWGGSASADRLRRLCACVYVCSNYPREPRWYGGPTPHIASPRRISVVHVRWRTKRSQVRNNEKYESCTRLAVLKLKRRDHVEGRGLGASSWEKCKLKCGENSTLYENRWRKSRKVNMVNSPV